MSPPLASEEIFVKWLLIVLLATTMPVPFSVPMVGTYPTSVFLIVIGNAALIAALNPFSVMVLIQVAIYTLLIYVLAKYMARYFISGANKAVKWLLAALLLVNFLLAYFSPMYGFGYDTSLFDQYRELL